MRVNFNTFKMPSIQQPNFTSAIKINHSIKGNLDVDRQDVSEYFDSIFTEEEEMDTFIKGLEQFNKEGKNDEYPNLNLVLEPVLYNYTRRDGEEREIKVRADYGGIWRSPEMLFVTCFPVKDTCEILQGAMHELADAFEGYI